MILCLGVGGSSLQPPAGAGPADGAQDDAGLPDAAPGRVHQAEEARVRLQHRGHDHPHHQGGILYPGLVMVTVQCMSGAAGGLSLHRAVPGGGQHGLAGPVLPAVQLHPGDTARWDEC